MTTDIAVGAANLDEILPVDVIGSSPLPLSGLMQLINGHYIAQAIYVCARLRIPDALAEKPRTAADLAAALATAPANTARLLRVLQGVGLLTRDGEAYGLTETGQFLRADLETSLRPLAMLTGAPWRWATAGRLTEAVQSGSAQFSAANGAGYYDFLESDDNAAEVFFGAMDSLAVAGQTIAAATHDFSSYTDVFDIGGGDGTVLSAILTANPQLRGHLADRPHALQRAEAVMTKAGVTDRVTYHNIDFFDTVPPGGDCYVLSLILNDCDDTAAATLLTNCRQAMGADATLVALDFVIRDDARLHHADYLDLEGMLFSGGQARTEDQFRALLFANGLQLDTVTHNLSPISCITARPQ
jgi:C-methyltransferase